MMRWIVTASVPDSAGGLRLDLESPDRGGEQHSVTLTAEDLADLEARPQPGPALRGLLVARIAVLESRLSRPRPSKVGAAIDALVGVVLGA
jgi:hypothetical protein